MKYSIINKDIRFCFRFCSIINKLIWSNYALESVYRRCDDAGYRH